MQRIKILKDETTKAGRFIDYEPVGSSSSSSNPPVPPAPPIPPISNPPTPPLPPNTKPPGPVITVPNQELKIDNVGDLQNAFASAVPAGSTLWLRGGKYQGKFLSRLSGTDLAPVTLRGYPGERAILIGAQADGICLQVAGSNSQFRDIEVTGNPSTRIIKNSGTETSYPEGIDYPGGIDVGNPNFPVRNVRFVHVAVYDTQQGFGLWEAAQNVECYGCLSFMNGWDGPDRGHGHGFYVQNKDGTKRLIDCIAFAGFALGMQVYGKLGSINGITAQGNILWSNGELGHTGIQRNLLIGGGVMAVDSVITDNFEWYPLDSDPGFNLGYHDSGAGSSGAIVRRNVFPGRASIQSPHTGLAMDGNTIGTPQGFAASDFPANHYGRPTKGQEIYIRPSQYERGRGHIATYNWDQSPNINVDLTAVQIADGENYAVWHGANPFGNPVMSGTAQPGKRTVTLPTGLVSPLVPRGENGGRIPSKTGPIFNAFIVRLTA